MQDHSIEQLDKFLKSTEETVDKLMMIRNMAVEKHNSLVNLNKKNLEGEIRIEN